MDNVIVQDPAPISHEIRHPGRNARLANQEILFGCFVKRLKGV